MSGDWWWRGRRMTNKTCQCPHSPGWLRWFDHQELSSVYCQPSQDNASVILKLQKNPPITFFPPLFLVARVALAAHSSPSIRVTMGHTSDLTSLEMWCLARTAALTAGVRRPPAVCAAWSVETGQTRPQTPVWPPALGANPSGGDCVSD